MKKLILILLAGLLALPVLAQHEVSPASLATSENGVVSLDVLNHVSWGYDFVKSDAFTPRGGGEVNLNTFGLDIYPSENFGIETGLDCKWQYFNTRESQFLLDGNRVPQASFPNVLKADRKESSLNVFSLSIPVMAKAYLEKFFFGVGAEACFNLTGHTEFVYDNGNVRVDVTESKAKLNLFTYDFMGMVGYDDMAVYGKFYPKNSRFVPEGGVPFSYWTLGVIFFL